MKLILLGTGDAIGTPRIGCSCDQCIHAKENGLQRLRTSLLIETDGQHILVDTGPDLRQQLLNTGSPHIDAVLWTHGHYDHFMGFGEFYRVQKIPDAYAPEEVMKYCGDVFRFLDFGRHTVREHTPFDLNGITITFLPVIHPPVFTCGILVEWEGVRVGYTSDAIASLPKKTAQAFRGVDLLLVDALLPPRLHVPKHMNYQEACDLAGLLGAGDFRCVHMSHTMPWDLPHLGIDGETIIF